jgi:ubiquinone/menaquinone biosynthesis C-methylase UbiE
MRISEAYTTWAATYDTVENPTRDLDQIVTQKTLSHLRCKAILELGCGTGKNTALLAQIGEQVQAIDFSEGMVAQAKAKILADNVTFTAADLTQQWPCADQSVDLIVCNLVLEHIVDLSFIFAEAARCLVPTGRFFICELHPFKQYQGIKATFEHDQQQTEIPAFVHHISDFLAAAEQQGLTLQEFKEWWREINPNKPPLLASFMFVK